MVSLEERKMCIPHICMNCHHVISIEISSDEGCYEEYFCTLGMSDEDLKIVNEELSDPYYNGLFPDDHEYSEPFKKVFGVAGSKDPYCIFDSNRYVEDKNCCQFFEHIGLLKDEE